MGFETLGARSFRAQLTLTIALIVFVSIALVSALANVFINEEFAARAKEQQKSGADGIAANLSLHHDGAAGEWDVEYVHGVGMAALYDGYIIRLMDSSGAVVWDAENHDMKTCNQVMMDIISRMREKRPGLDGSFSTQEYALEQDGRRIGSVAIQYYGPYSLSEGDLNFLDSLNLALAAIGALALACSLLVGGALAKRISRPVIRTAHIATQIAEGNYKIRLEGGMATRELRELAEAVNHMAASLESQEGLRKRLTTDVAHELRTPLTAAAAHLEAMIEGLWETTPKRLQSCYEEIGRLSGLIADLERLAEVENENLRLTMADVDLLELAAVVVGNFERSSAEKSLQVAVSGTTAIVSADKDRLNQVLANLLSNAIKHTPEKGDIRINVRDDGKNGVVVIEDNGVGIPETDLPFIFERFYRADKSRGRSTGGAGIGLTIARSIVSAHGGTITAESRANEGSRFTLVLPKRG